MLFVTTENPAEFLYAPLKQKATALDLNFGNVERNISVTDASQEPFLRENTFALVKTMEYDILEEFKVGLNLVTRAKAFRIIPFYSPDIDTVATFLHRHHKDYVDCSILASAYVEASIFVTLEKKKMKELAELIPPELSIYRKTYSQLIVATLPEAVKEVSSNEHG